MANSQPIKIAYNTHEPVGGVDETLAPIIFLHGLTANKEYWRDIPQVVANYTKREIYAIDARNHGDSDWIEHFNFDVNADDLIHMMDTVGIKKAILVGHSMGGTTAIKTALKRPDRVEKIVVEDMVVAKVSKERLKMVSLYVTLGRKAMEAALPDLDEDGVKLYVMNCIKENLEKLLPPEMRMFETSQDYENRVKILQVRRNTEGCWEFKNNMKVIEKALQNPDTLSSDAQGTFEGPACFIYGRLSPFLVGADEHNIKQFFPNAVLVGIEEAGHSVHTDRPLEFTDALLKFIS